MSTNPVIVGSNLTYTFRVNNNGRTSFTGVTNKMQFPANLQITSASSTVGTCTTNGGLLTCNFGTLTNNASATVTVGVTAVTPATLTNVATLTALETEINSNNNIATVISAVRGVADVTVVGLRSPDPVAMTSNLTFTIAVTNKGPWPATFFALTNPMPSILQIVSATSTVGSCTTNFGTVTCDLGTMASGAGALVTVVAKALTNDRIDGANHRTPTRAPASGILPDS